MNEKNPLAPPFGLRPIAVSDPEGKGRGGGILPYFPSLRWGEGVGEGEEGSRSLQVALWVFFLSTEKPLELSEGRSIRGFLGNLYKK